LGVYKSICGKESDHLKHLQEKSNNIVASVWSGQLNRRQSWLAYNCNYIPAMVNSLPAMCLSEPQLYKVQSKATCKFLQLNGFDERFPRAAAFGPISHSGLGMREFYTECMHVKVESLMCHVHFMNSLGKSMRTNILWIHILLGVGVPLLESSQFIQYMHVNWFLNIRDFINVIQGLIKIRHLWQPTLLHQTDFFIMEKLI
jgi:hypothetical protein